MGKATIVSVSAAETYSDHGYPAVQVKVITESGATGEGSSTESYSTSSYQPKYLYDGGSRFHGFGATCAAGIINRIIAPRLIGAVADNQSVADAIIKDVLDENDIPHYVNVTSPVSVAVLKAGASSLTLPLFRHLGGRSAFTIPVGSHICASGSKRYGGIGKVTGKPVYSMVTYGFNSFAEAHYALWKTTNAYEKIRGEKYGLVIHRGFSAGIPAGKVEDDSQLWDVFTESIDAAGYRGKIGLCADMGANEYYNRETGLYEGLFSSKPKTRDEMIALVEKMASDYPFIIIQDPLEENDMAGYTHLTASTGIQIVGDDLFSSNVERIKECIAKKCVNSVILPVNRFKTVSDVIEVVRFAKSYGADVMPKDFCGEGDSTVDYAVAFNAGTIYGSGLIGLANYLLLMEEQIGPRAKFYGAGGIQGKKFSLQ